MNGLLDDICRICPAHQRRIWLSPNIVRAAQLPEPASALQGALIGPRRAETDSQFMAEQGRFLQSLAHGNKETNSLACPVHAHSFPIGSLRRSTNG